jgi:hypothetical protein
VNLWKKISGHLGSVPALITSKRVFSMSTKILHPWLYHGFFGFYNLKNSVIYDLSVPESGSDVK